MTKFNRTFASLGLWMTVVLSPGILFAAGNPDNIYCSPSGQPLFGVADGPAQMPQTCFYTALSGTPSPGIVIPVASGGNVNAALAQASCGDIIELAAGGTYTPFTLPAKNCDANHWITIRTSAYASLPPEGTRVSPCYAGVASLPGRPAYNCPAGGTAKLTATVTTPNSGLAIGVASGANYYRLIGLEITRVPGIGIVYNLLQTDAADHIIYDRVWAHGNATEETTRGLALGDGHHIAVIDSYFSDFHCTAVTGTCTDAQAVAGGNDSLAGVAGTYKIVNNFLESAAENILFGGGHSEDVVPDIEVRRNHLFKPMTWNPSDPNFIGTKFIVKNNFEMKNGQRVLVEGNILENTWGGFSQIGAHVLLTPKNQGGAGGVPLCPICQVKDVTLRYNSATHGGQGLQLADGANDFGAYATAGYNWSVHDILFDALNYPTCFGCANYMNEVAGGIPTPATDVLHNVTVDHITGITMAQPAGFLTLGGAMASTGLQQYNIKIMNSIYDAGHYGPWSTGGTWNCAFGQNSPLAKFNACWATYNFTGNVLANGLVIQQTPTWPNGNFFPTSVSGIGYANYNNGSGGDYHLCHGLNSPAPCTVASPYMNQGNDGKDPGADINAVNCYTSGVTLGSPNLNNCSVSQPPSPSLVSLAPNSAAAGGPAFTLTVTGSNFISGSVIQWNGAAKTTTFVTTTQLTAAILATDIANPGTASVTVSNPAPNLGTSNPLTFTINGVTSNPPVPSTPTLILPAFLPINATIIAGYTGSDPASYFQWTFTSVAQIPTGSLAASKAMATGAPSASFTTSSPRANLGSVSLGVGPYLVTVKVYDNNGVASSPAQAYVTLVPADLSSARVYPNPWRADKHASLSITFDNLALNTTVKIFTVSGHWVKTLPMSNTLVTWDLTNDSDDKVASGLYIYLLTNDQGSKKTGQIAVIK